MSGLAFLFVFQTSSAEIEKNFYEGLKLSPSEPERAKKFFDSVSKDSLHFQDALTENLKILYRLEDWPSFFSYAQYFRNQFSEHKRDVLALELLALLRHCQNEPLYRLIEEFRNEKTLPIEVLDNIEALSRTHFKGKRTPSKNYRPWLARWSGETLWKSSRKMLLNHHPRQFKIRVENLCIE